MTPWWGREGPEPEGLCTKKAQINFSFHEFLFCPTMKSGSGGGGGVQGEGPSSDGCQLCLGRGWALTRTAEGSGPAGHQVWVGVPCGGERADRLSQQKRTKAPETPHSRPSPRANMRTGIRHYTRMWSTAPTPDQTVRQPQHCGNSVRSSDGGGTPAVINGIETSRNAHRK